MGIYSSGDIYGIKIYSISYDNILFEIKMDTILSDEKKEKVKNFYNGLSEYDKTKVKFQIYTDCSSTYSNDIFMTWEPLTLDLFIQKFSI